MKPSTILRKVRTLLGPRGGHWVQGKYETGSGKRTRYCLLGGIDRFANTLASTDTFHYIYLAISKLRFKSKSILVFNDTHNFKQVAKVIDLAISMAKKDGK